MDRSHNWPRPNRFKNLGGYVEGKSSHIFKPLEERIKSANEANVVTAQHDKKMHAATIGTELVERHQKLIKRKKGFWQWCLKHGISVPEAQRRWVKAWRADPTPLRPD